jgi:hypothetical protein
MVDPDNKTAFIPNRLSRFGLRTLLLLIACVAVWLAYFRAIDSISNDLKEIEVLHSLAPEVFVRKQDEYACLVIDRTDSIEEFHCYLPPGSDYQLNLNCHNHFEASQLGPAELSHPLSAGTYHIYLDYNLNRLVVRVDEKIVFDVSLPSNYDLGSNFSSGARTQFGLQWYDWERPLVLRSKIPAKPNSSGKTAGYVLWIDR